MTRHLAYPFGSLLLFTIVAAELSFPVLNGPAALIPDSLDEP